jgi:hypothetical protein
MLEGHQLHIVKRQIGVDVADVLVGCQALYAAYTEKYLKTTTTRYRVAASRVACANALSSMHPQDRAVDFIAWKKSS